MRARPGRRPWLWGAWLGIGLWLAALVGLPAVQAAGTVTNCSNDTEFSSALSGGGTVTFNCGGVGASATLTLSSTKTIATSVTIDGGGKITLSGGNARRLFQVNSGVTLTLLNITISNGSAFGGGAILNSGNLVIDASTFSNNTLTGQFGGAISSTGAVTVTNSLFSNNTSPGGYGGAIDSALTTSRVAVANSTFTNNSANLGGGAIASNGIVIVADSTFSNNSTASSGGSSGGGAIESTGALTVTASTFTGNLAGKGGGVYNEGGTAVLVNSTFSGNSANVSPRTGGGVHNQASTDGSNIPGVVKIIASTFSGNTAPSGSGGSLYNTAGSTLTVRQSILAGGSPANCSGTMTSQGSNIDSGPSCGFSAGGDLPSTNPQIDPLADNGGATYTHALQANSPARDAALICTDAVNGALGVDQRAVARPQGGACDIGAYEQIAGGTTPTATATRTATPTLTVTATASPTASQTATPTATQTRTATPPAGGWKHVYLPSLRR